jgi:hypothetical protein
MSKQFALTIRFRTDLSGMRSHIEAQQKAGDYKARHWRQRI